MRRVSERVLQEYLETLADQGARDSAQRSRDLLTSFAELQFRCVGGSRCQICRASVRHVLPVSITREDGSVKKYSCLCHRCLTGERATAKAVEIRLGPSSWLLKKPEPLSRQEKTSRATHQHKRRA